MAKSCGIRIGAGAFELVVLDGSAKKHRVVHAVSGTFAGDGPADPKAAGNALKSAMKGLGVPTENLGLAMDSRHAAFRKLKLPFTDRSKIESVLKFEVEGELPQFSIEDVVVDFLVLAQAADGAQLLTTAVPKTEIQRALAALKVAGVEPLEVELEVTAMVNAAHAAGITQADTAIVLVHVGEESTSVVTVDGGSVNEMRVIHLGAGSPAPDGAAQPRAEGSGEGSEGTPGVEAPSSLERERILEQATQRIRRELLRTISGARTARELGAVHVCGRELPGLVGSELMGLPVERLAIAPDGGAPLPSGSEIAYGVALRQLGGGTLSPSLRREELRFTGAFERLELPLAVAALMLVTLAGVWNIFLSKEVQLLRESLANWWRSSNNFMLTNLQAGSRGNLEFPSETLGRYVRNVEAGTGESGAGSFGNELSRFDSLNRVRALIDADIREMRKQLGRDTEIKHPQSALKGMALVLEVFSELGDEIGRFSIRQIDARQQRPSQRTPEHVRVTMDVAFFANSPAQATENYERLVAAFNSKPWRMNFTPKENTPLEDSKGIYLQGIVFEVDLAKAVGDQVWN